MICSKCNTEAIENQAGGKIFHYCRTCKDEVFPAERVGRKKFAGSSTAPDEDFIDLTGLTDEEEAQFEAWMKRIKQSQQAYEEDQYDNDYLGGD